MLVTYVAYLIILIKKFGWRWVFNKYYEVNIWDVYAYITSMVFLVASNSGTDKKTTRTKKTTTQWKETEKVNAAY